MWQLANKLILFCALLMATSLVAKSEKPTEKNKATQSQKQTHWFIQAKNVVLKSGPKMSAKTVGALKRGDTVQVIKSQGPWRRVSGGNKKGWMPKFFLSRYQPISRKALLEKLPDNPAKANRRRPSSYTVSAATRGLMAGERSRHGRELYRSDYDALERMESYQVTQPQYQSFRKSGGFEDEVSN